MVITKGVYVCSMNNLAVNMFSSSEYIFWGFGYLLCVPLGKTHIKKCFFSGWTTKGEGRLTTKQKYIFFKNE